MNRIFYRNIGTIIAFMFLLSNILIIGPSERVEAGSYDGEDLALAILTNASWLVSSSYTDSDASGHRQSIVLSSLGTMSPTAPPTFAFFSTGIAGADIITTDEEEPGDERGSWFAGGTKGYPRDEATLTMTLQVPMYMHYLYYDVQFLSAEYPEYVGTQFNDKLTITVNSPSEGTSTYFFDVNSGYFVVNSNGIPGTGFDIFARSGDPGGVDIVDTVPRTPGADAGASGIIPIGGELHPVSPNEEITVTINIRDDGDNLFDSGAYIDNFVFTGFAKTEIIGRKEACYETGGLILDNPVEPGDIIKYRVTITNIGTADQDNNPGNEFEDFIPADTTYVGGSAYAEYGTIAYNAGENKITWNGAVPSETSRVLEFEVTVNDTVSNGTIISNQGSVFWDSDEDGDNDALELTDNQYIDDGIDQDLDGETNDDDPTNVTVIIFEPPASVTEDFSDDTAGQNATQSYLTRDWFETSSGVLGSVFEVAPSYKHLTAKSFKTKLRSSGSPQYWNYTLSELESDMTWWEVWFACGNASEGYDLFLDLENNFGEDIARIKFDYSHSGTDPPTDWVLELYYWNPGSGWSRLYSDFAGGYLRNSWYKLKIEKNGENFINYYLDRSGVGQVDFATGNKLPAIFENFAQVEWSSTKDPDPIVCPIFFWDDHTIGLG